MTVAGQEGCGISKDSAMGGPELRLGLNAVGTQSSQPGSACMGSVMGSNIWQVQSCPVQELIELTHSAAAAIILSDRRRADNCVSGGSWRVNT